MSTDALPLLTLQPFADSAQRWAGVLLHGEPGAPAAALTAAIQRLCGEFGLHPALAGLPCALPPGLLAEPALAAVLPPGQTLLRLPAALWHDPQRSDEFATWRAQAYRLLADGPPPAEGAYPASITGRVIDHAAGDDLSRSPTLRGPHLALGVNDEAALARCRDAGIDWVAGDYPLTQPVKPAVASPGRAVMLKLLAQVSADADTALIEATLKQDQQLSYQLLKMVNSVAFSLDNKIGSFKQAIALLGRRQLQRWVQLLLYGRKSANDLANPLMPRAALRAGLLESLAAAAGEDKPAQDQAFMVGMFSLLEPLLGQPMTTIIQPLNLPGPVAQALLARGGAHGTRLAAVEACENGAGAAARRALDDAGISVEAWTRVQSHAWQWAIKISREA